LAGVNPGYLRFLRIVPGLASRTIRVVSGGLESEKDRVILKGRKRKEIGRVLKRKYHEITKPAIWLNI